MLQVFRPPAAVAHWIDGAVVMRLDARAAVSRFPAMPHAMLTMRVLRCGSLQPLCGPISFHTLSTVAAAYTHAGEITALGLLVRPAAAACLLGHATGAMANQVLDWSDLAGDADASRAAQEVEGARTDIDRLRSLLATFRRAMAVAAGPRAADLALFCDAIGRHGAQAAEPLGLGRRQLERRCQSLLGVAPKQFQRLTRFHAALSSAVATGAHRLSELALDAGFFDQSHLGRDTRRLAGLPMSRLLAAARPESAWWPLATRPLLNGRGAREL